MKKAIIALVLAILLVLNACGGGGADNSGSDTVNGANSGNVPVPAAVEARTMVVSHIDGAAATMTRGTGPEVNAAAGARLGEGYTVATPVMSFCYIVLDQRSQVKIDEQSRISIDRATDRLLSIAVESGQILVDVQGQSPGHTIETRLGNVMFGVRGTLFVAGQGVGDGAFIVMLEGSGEVDGRPLKAGEIALITGGEAQEIRGWELEELNGFILQAILDNQDRVLAAGAVTADALDRLMMIRLPGEYIHETGHDAGNPYISLASFHNEFVFYWDGQLRNITGEFTVADGIVTCHPDVMSLQHPEFAALGIENFRFRYEGNALVFIEDFAMSRTEYGDVFERVSWETEPNSLPETAQITAPGVDDGTGGGGTGRRTPRPGPSGTGTGPGGSNTTSGPDDPGSGPGTPGSAETGGFLGRFSFHEGGTNHGAMFNITFNADGTGIFNWLALPNTHIDWSVAGDNRASISYQSIAEYMTIYGTLDGDTLTVIDPHFPDNIYVFIRD